MGWFRCGGGVAYTGQTNVTPTTNDIVLPTKGRELANDITVQGDADLVAGNIISGKTIFGVAGTAKKDRYSMNCQSIYLDGSTSDDSYKSFTMPRAGIVCYSGFSFAVSRSFNGVCRILRNGSVVDNRDIDGNQWAFRGTMVDKSFSASAGDVIAIQTSRNGNIQGGCLINAVIFY